MLVVGRESGDRFCERLAEDLKKLNNGEPADFFPVEHKHFPDGETLIKLTDGVKSDIPNPERESLYKDPAELTERARKGEPVVVVSRGVAGEEWDPLDIFVDAVFMAGALRERCSDAQICTVLPYYIFSRQHDEFRPGQPISAKYITQILKDREKFGNMVITVSAHQKRDEGQVDNRVWNMDATESAIAYAKTLPFLEEKYLVTPDSGQYSGKLRFPFAEEIRAGTIALGKERDRVTELVSVDARTLGRLSDPGNTTLLFYDDELSTGGTLYEHLQMCFEYGIKPENIYVIVVHNKNAMNNDHKRRGVELIQSTDIHVAASDTIESPISCYSVVPQLARYIKKRFA